MIYITYPDQPFGAAGADALLQSLGASDGFRQELEAALAHLGLGDVDLDA